MHMGIGRILGSNSEAEEGGALRSAREALGLEMADGVANSMPGGKEKVGFSVPEDAGIVTLTEPGIEGLWK